MHSENHSMDHVSWLRAAVLGANDGIVSTASLLLGVASANATHQGILLAGVAGLVAGAMSMAAGEYVSVSSQSDTEQAALKQETQELKEDYSHELDELTNIYVGRGVEPVLAKEVAQQLMTHDALAAHARDELGISEMTIARPLQAAIVSALSFSFGAFLPLIITIWVPLSWLIPAIVSSTIISLALLGGFAAKMGRASIIKGVIRVTFWSILAMVASSVVGMLFNVAVG